MLTVFKVGLIVIHVIVPGTVFAPLTLLQLVVFAQRLEVTSAVLVLIAALVDSLSYLLAMNSSRFLNRRQLHNVLTFQFPRMQVEEIALSHLLTPAQLDELPTLQNGQPIARVFHVVPHAEIAPDWLATFYFGLSPSVILIKDLPVDEVGVFRVLHEIGHAAVSQLGDRKRRGPIAVAVMVAWLLLFVPWTAFNLAVASALIACVILLRMTWDIGSGPAMLQAEISADAFALLYMNANDRSALEARCRRKPESLYDRNLGAANRKRIVTLLRQLERLRGHATERDWRASLHQLYATPKWTPPAFFTLVHLALLFALTRLPQAHDSNRLWLAFGALGGCLYVKAFVDGQRSAWLRWKTEKTLKDRAPTYALDEMGETPLLPLRQSRRARP
jgi:hypothetical protein